MTQKMVSTQWISVLSGKGGTGKTVLALSMAKILVEAGLKTLVVDCDVLTHGASYFFESELDSSSVAFLSFEQLMSNKSQRGEILKTKDGFHFIPSFHKISELDHFGGKAFDWRLVETAFNNLDYLVRKAGYDVVILDCHAGFSYVVRYAVMRAKSQIFVLEPDAISSASLRVLYLQLAENLKTSDTWQIFNKLTEEERPVYEKVSAGTLFPSLPPIPFDWQVRAAFALRKIPALLDSWSAFGLGVLRIMKVVFS